MSGIIKSVDLAGHARVRPLSRPAPSPVVSAADEERERLRSRIAQLEVEIHQRDLTVAGLRGEVDAAFERGRSEGHAAGLRAAEDREAERTALLGTALRAARERLDDSLKSLDGLAAAIAAECLDVILGDRKHRAAALRKIIAAQVSRIEKSALLAVELSGADFPDAEAFAGIRKDVALEGVALNLSPDVAPGGCRMVLKLGRIEAGLDRQWGTLRGLLEETATTGPAP
jgi:flagellar biosynthesis/type III secretory pathway protein FliH